METCAKCYWYQPHGGTVSNGAALRFCACESEKCAYLSVTSVQRERQYAEYKDARRFRVWAYKEMPQILPLLDNGELSHHDIHWFCQYIDPTTGEPITYYVDESNSSGLRKKWSPVFKRHSRDYTPSLEDYLALGLGKLDREEWVAQDVANPYFHPSNQRRPVASPYRDCVTSVMRVITHIYEKFGFICPAMNLESPLQAIASLAEKELERFRTQWLQAHPEEEASLWGREKSLYLTDVEYYKKVVHENTRLRKTEFANKLGESLAFFREMTGKPLPESLCRVVGDRLARSPYQIKRLAERWDWAAYNRSRKLFEGEVGDLKESLWVKTYLIFGARSADWLRAMSARGLSRHDATYWLPTAPQKAEALAEVLFKNSKANLSNLQLVAATWGDLAKDYLGFSSLPSFAKLVEEAQTKRSLAITQRLSGELPLEVRQKIADVAGRYNLTEQQVVEGSREVAPALLGKVAIHPQLNYPTVVVGEITIRFLAKTDPLGMALGRATNCCQEWGSDGQACMVAGYIFPESTFLVAEESATGKILAQAWVYLVDKVDDERRGKKQETRFKNLVLDNIEIAHKDTVSLEILGVFGQWAKRYTALTGLGVRLGTGYSDFVTSHLEKVDEPSRLTSYHGYTDARNQVWLSKPSTSTTTSTTSNRRGNLPAEPVQTETATTYVVRNMRREDAPTVRMLERHIYPETLVSGLEELENLGRNPDDSDDWAAGLLLLARTTDDVEKLLPVGYLLAEGDEDYPVYVVDLAILPEHRRRGVQPLVTGFHSLCQNNEVATLRARLRENTSYRLLVRHGEKLGFVIKHVLRREQDEESGEVFAECVLETV